jgi:hypothetical protein
MWRSRQKVWFFAVLGFVVAVAQLLMLPRQVWAQLFVMDWVVIALLLRRRSSASGNTSGMSRKRPARC